MEKKYLYLKYYFKYLWFVMLICIIISCVDHLSFIFWKWFTFLFKKKKTAYAPKWLFFSKCLWVFLWYIAHITHILYYTCFATAVVALAQTSSEREQNSNTNTYNPPNSNWDENSVHISVHITSASLGKITFTLFFKSKVIPVVFTLKAELKESVTWLINLYTGPPQQS